MTDAAEPDEDTLGLRPGALAAMIALLGAFAYSLFFKGYADTSFAPAVLLLLATGVVVMIPACWRGLRLPCSGTALALLAFWVYVSLSLTWTTVPFASLITYLIVITIPLVFLIFSSAVPWRDWSRPAMAALLVALAALGVWAVWQVTILSGTYGPRAHHPLLNANNLAILLVLGALPLLGFTIAAENGKRALLLYLPAVLALLAGVQATGSRAALLCLLLCSAVLCFMMRDSVRRNARRVMLTVLLAASVFTAFEIKNGGETLTRMAALAAPAQDEAVAARVATWQSAFEMLAQRPLTGTGLGTFYLYYPAHRSADDKHSAGYWAHMDPLQYGVEMGILAPLLFYGMLAAVLLRTLAALKNIPGDDPRRVWIAGPFAALLALALHVHVSFDLYVMPVLIVAGVWLALRHAATAEALPARPSYRTLAAPVWGRVALMICVIAVAGLVATMTVRSALAIHYLTQARAAAADVRGSDFLKLAMKAETIAPASFIDTEVHMAGFYADMLQHMAPILSPEEKKGIFADGIDLLAQAESLNPAWAEIDYRRGLLNASAGTDIAPDGPAAATAAFEKAIIKNPMHFKARGALALAYMDKGRVEDAARVVRDGLAYPHPPEVDAEYNDFLKRIDSLLAAKHGFEKERAEKKAP